MGNSFLRGGGVVYIWNSLLLRKLSLLLFCELRIISPVCPNGRPHHRPTGQCQGSCQCETLWGVLYWARSNETHGIKFKSLVSNFWVIIASPIYDLASYLCPVCRLYWVESCLLNCVSPQIRWPALYLLSAWNIAALKLAAPTMPTLCWCWNWCLMVSKYPYHVLEGYK